MFNLKKSHVFPPLVMLAGTFALVPSAHSGGGTFQGGKHNFCVSVRFNATPEQLEKMRVAFSNASQVLADATDGQHQFGTIKIANNSGASQSAEFWVNPGEGRAYATLGNYGVRGEHVNMFFESNFNATYGADGDAYTIAHEHTHHSYGVADEYFGPAGDAEDAPPPDTPTLDYSLMDNFFTRGGRAFGSDYTLNEFCTAANHDPDRDTMQHSVNGESIWETIAAHPTRSAIAPAGLPISAPPPPHTVAFQDSPARTRAMLLLNRSGNMNSGQGLNLVRQGVNQFVKSFTSGGSLGVASFSELTRVDSSLTRMAGDIWRTVSKTVSGAMATGGTDIGGALLAALGQITAQPERSCDELIILMSDRDHSTGTSPAKALASLQAEGVTVLSVGVGNSISTAGEAELQNIASQTGGKFYRVPDTAGLAGVFMQLAAESSGHGMLARVPEVLGSGQSRQIPVLVEEGAEGATFAIAQANSQDVMDMSLLSPSGKILTPNDPARNPDIKFSSESNSKVFRINAPEAGAWKIIVNAGKVVTGKFETLAFASHDGVQLNVSTSKDTVASPEAIEVHATPRFKGESVVGANIAGTVQRPDGSSVQLQLYDDGLAEHGDRSPGDGIYSARFNQYKSDGTYTFQLKMESAEGKTYAGERLFTSQPSNEKIVPAFSRVASTTAVVTGVSNSF